MSEISSPEVEAALEAYHDAMRDGTDRDIKKAEAQLWFARLALSQPNDQESEED